MGDTLPELLAVTLESERLLLRPIRREDAAFAAQHFTDPAVNRFLLDDEPITTTEQAAAIVAFYVDAPGASYNRWVLVRKADGVSLGTCGYHRWSRQHHKAEIGYDLSPAWHGQGYMREAVATMLRHGFGPMGLHRVEASSQWPTCARRTCCASWGLHERACCATASSAAGASTTTSSTRCLAASLAKMRPFAPARDSPSLAHCVLG